MALDFTGLMTVLGENIKKIDIFNTLITSLETYKDDIYTDLAAEGFQDQYVPYPAQFLSMKNAVSGWINTLKSNMTAVLLDPELVLDELDLYSYDITSVLNALYDYMDDNSETIESSVVTLDGQDVHHRADGALIGGVADTVTVAANAISQNTGPPPFLFCCRTLDGTSAPGNGVTAHIRYDGAESQLARSAVIKAELISNSTIGAETAILYSPLTASSPYTAAGESPGQGPTLTNPEAANLIEDNAKFDNWTGDSPDDWSMSGTVTTDYEDASSSGLGPLRINTQGVTALQQIDNILHNKLYFIGVWFTGSQGDTDPEVVGIKLRTLADAAITTQVTGAIEAAVDKNTTVVYDFFRLPVTTNLSDIYLEIEYVTAGHANSYVDIKKAVIAPATYYNGLAWVWWPPAHTTSSADYVETGIIASMTVSNNNNGKFQTAFRRLYNIQLPTADSPTVNDALAGG